MSLQNIFTKNQLTVKNSKPVFTILGNAGLLSTIPIFRKLSIVAVFMMFMNLGIPSINGSSLVYKKIKIEKPNFKVKN